MALAGQSFTHNPQPTRIRLGERLQRTGQDHPGRIVTTEFVADADQGDPGKYLRLLQALYCLADRLLPRKVGHPFRFQIG